MAGVLIAQNWWVAQVIGRVCSAMVASAILFLAEKDTAQGAQRALRFIGDIVWGIVLLLKADISRTSL